MKKFGLMVPGTILILALVLGLILTGCGGVKVTVTTTPGVETTSTVVATVTGKATPTPYKTATKTTTAAPTTTEAPPVEPGAIVSWKDAAKYMGQTITVEGPIIDSFNNAGNNIQGMGVSVFAAGAVGIEISDAIKAQFPADFYVGKTIRVTGKVYQNPTGGASIVVTDPSQIEVVE